MRLPLRSATLASLALIGAPLFAAEGETKVEKVSVGGFALEPWGNITSPDGAVTVHPKALLGVAYNSNVYATPTNEEGDVFYTAVAGVDVGWRMSEADKLTLSAEYMGQWYASEKNRNLSGAKGVARYRHTAQRWEAGMMAAYARTDNPFISTGEQIQHDDIDAAVDGLYKAARASVGLGATFHSRNYLERSRFFDENDRDYKTVGGTARVGYEVGEDSELYVRGFVDQRNYTKDTLSTGGPGFNDSTGVGGLLGAKAKLGTRSALIAELGATYRQYEHEFRQIPAYDDETVIAPAGNLIFRWNFEEGSWVGARAFSSLEESVSSNAAWLYGASIDARYRLLEKAALFGSIAGYQLKSSGHNPATQAGDEVRTTGEVTLGAEYILRKGLGLRLKNVYTDSNSKFFNDFTRDIISLELGFVY